MELEQFFESVSYICLKVLPIIGVVLGIYLIVMVHNLIKTLKSATKTLDETHQQIRKLDVPLHTISEISKSIDSVHELTKESLHSLSIMIYENLSALKEWFKNLFHKEKDNDEVVVRTEVPVEGEQENGRE